MESPIRLQVPGMVEPHPDFCSLEQWSFEVDSAFWDFGDGVKGWIQLSQPSGDVLGVCNLLGLGELSTRVVTGYGRFGIPHPKTRMTLTALVSNTSFTDVFPGVEVTENPALDEFESVSATHYIWTRPLITDLPPFLFDWVPVGPLYRFTGVLDVRPPPGF